jgi:two-component system chemotaxis response regulator CheY
MFFLEIVMNKVLVVDDSRSMRTMIAMTLRQAGYEVDEAENGKEGLEKASSGHYKLIMTDINMPIMTGIEMISSVRQLPSHRLTPILCLTTESGEDMKAKGKAAGATGWIVKPFTPEKLVSTVQRVL